MRVSALSSLLLTLLIVACAAEPEGEHQNEWRAVLDKKRAADAPGAPPARRQAYADSVHRFVTRFPDHGRAREVWQRLQLDFADELAEAGRYRDAIRFYRSVLAHDGSNEHASRGLAAAAARIAVSRPSLLEVRKGMSRREVAGVLGRPLPGWTRETKRNRTEFEAWYYPTRAGGVAAVYFREGRVLAAEENSSALLGKL